MILYYNSVKNCLVTATGAVSTFRPVFAFLDLATVELHVVDAANAPRNLSHVKTWTAALDNDFRADTPVMAESGDDRFDATGAASGELVFTLDCGSEVWAAKTDGKYKIPAWLDVRGFDATGAQVERFLIRVDAQTIVDAGQGFPVPNDIASRSWVVALWRAGMAVQFSLDGVTPLDVEPEGGAKFYRIRPASHGGDWSVWMSVPRGETGAAATFAIVKTDTLPPGAPATVAEAEGSTSGARKYIVGVPEGRKGDKGDMGVTRADNPDINDGYMIDPDWGECGYLGSDSDYVSLARYWRNVAKVVLVLVSANPAITGNIVLVPEINGVEQTAVVVPVGAAPAAVEISIPVEGIIAIAFRRDWQGNRDTLRDGLPVTAIMISSEVWHA